MSQIEELLRQVLSETPAGTSATTVRDPLADVDRQVRRARTRLAIGGGAAIVAIVAAVLVPLSLGGGTTRNSLQVAQSPTPGATTTPGTTLLADEVKSVASDGLGSTSYVLVDWKVSSGASYVAMLSGGKLTHRVTLEPPADYLIADGDIAWVIGNDTEKGESRISAVSVATENKATITNPGRILGATVAFHSLYALVSLPDGSEVDRYQTDASGGLGLVGSTAVADATRIVTDGEGAVWVQTESHLVELSSADQTVRTVEWSGDSPLYGPVVPEGVWVYDGRLIGLSPANLASGVSVAEGARLPVSGRPVAVVSTPDGGVYYAVTAPGGGAGTGVFYYSAASVRRGDATKPVASLPGVAVTGLAVDPKGGVDMTREGGRLERWQPESR